MDNRPVAVFDSGLGGLTAVSVLRELMPEENIIYFGDTARCPYGKKSRDKIRSMTRDLIEYLMGYDPKALFAACGTISVNAGDVITSFGLPSVNVFDPAIEAIGKIGGTHPLSVIATEASIKTGAFQDGIRRIRPDREVIAVPCQDFVRLCETGHISPDDEELQASVRSLLAPVKEAKADAMILGCTHFGIIAGAISAYLGEQTKLISASGSAAHAMAQLIREHDMTASGTADEPADGTAGGAADGTAAGSADGTAAGSAGRIAGGGTAGRCTAGCGTSRFFTSGDPGEFEDLAGRILGLSIKAEHVDLPDGE